jgi:regulator of sigma E protease
VKIFGENPDDESQSGQDSARSLVHAAAWKQIVILLSGIFMNIVFAWILISLSFNLGMTTSISDQYKSNTNNPEVTILSVAKNSPSEVAGLREGDIILHIVSGTSTESHPSVSDIQNIVAQSSGSLTIVYERNNATSSVNMLATSSIVTGKKAIGISMAEVATVRFSFFRSFYEGAKLTVLETRDIVVGMCGFIWGLVRGQTGIMSEVSGPVGIVSMIGEARGLGLSYLLGFIATISLNLAVLNVVPFPALDGGRVMFACIELIIRRKIKPAILNWVNLIGFGILIALMLFVTYGDILKLIK